MLKGDYTAVSADEVDQALEREILDCGLGCLRGGVLRRLGFRKYDIDGRPVLFSVRNGRVHAAQGAALVDLRTWLLGLRGLPPDGGGTLAASARARAGGGCAEAPRVAPSSAQPGYFPASGDLSRRAARGMCGSAGFGGHLPQAPPSLSDGPLMDRVVALLRETAGPTCPPLASKQPGVWLQSALSDLSAAVLLLFARCDALQDLCAEHERRCLVGDRAQWPPDPKASRVGVDICAPNEVHHKVPIPDEVACGALSSLLASVQDAARHLDVGETPPPVFATHPDFSSQDDPPEPAEQVPPSPTHPDLSSQDDSAEPAEQVPPSPINRRATDEDHVIVSSQPPPKEFPALPPLVEEQPQQADPSQSPSVHAWAHLAGGGGGTTDQPLWSHTF